MNRRLQFDGELEDAQRARLAEIAERTPVTLTLKQGVTITTTCEQIAVRYRTVRATRTSK